MKTIFTGYQGRRSNSVKEWQVATYRLDSVLSKFVPHPKASVLHNLAGHTAVSALTMLVPFLAELYPTHERCRGVVNDALKVLIICSQSTLWGSIE